MTYQINIRGDLRNHDKELIEDLIEKFAFKGYNTKAGYSEASIRFDSYTDANETFNRVLSYIQDHDGDFTWVHLLLDCYEINFGVYVLKEFTVRRRDLYGKW